MVVKEVSYETSEPTVEFQIVTLQGSGCDVFIIAATPKFAAQALRKAFDIGWSPMRYMTYVSASIVSVMRPAGLDKSKGVISGAVGKDPNDPRWKDDPGLKEYAAFVAKYMTPSDFADALAAAGLWERHYDGARAQGVRRRSLARQHHAAKRPTSRISKFRCCCPASRSILRWKLPSDPATSARKVHWRKLGRVWRNHGGLSERLVCAVGPYDFFAPAALLRPLRVNFLGARVRIGVAQRVVPARSNNQSQRKCGFTPFPRTRGLARPPTKYMNDRNRSKHGGR